MAVYVDDMHRFALGRLGRMRMSHMVADSDDELHAMAARLGLDRRWHQNPGTPRSHYDICLAKRQLALKLGAVEITMREAARRTRGT